MPGGFRKGLKKLLGKPASEETKPKPGPTAKDDINQQLLSLLQETKDDRIESYLGLSMLGDATARQQLEKKIKADSLQKKGESMQETVTRLEKEFVAQWQDYEHDASKVPQANDRISDLIFTGRSDKPKTVATGLNATANDRSIAMIEQGLENLWNPKAPTHQTIQVDTSSLEWYSYRPLGVSRSIRLLCFHEDEYEFSPDYGKQKVCTIETVPLDEAPPYLALSYCWEAPRVDQACKEEYKSTRKWIVNAAEGGQQQLTIARNLYEALQRITKAKSATRHVWIDAFCINQDDEEEKTSQVAFMDAIYSQSARVLVWLGEMDAYKAAGIYLLHFDILPEMVKYIQNHGAESVRSGDWTEADLRERFGLADVARRNSDWKAYCELFQQCSWFTRAWCLQEIALASDAIVVFAHISLPFMEMVLMANFLQTSGLADEIMAYNSEGAANTVPGAILGVFNHNQQMIKAAKAPGGLAQTAELLGLESDSQVAWKTFSRAISTLRDMQSTRPHDRIFAALGFLHVDRAQIGTIIPNYDISLQELFTDITARCLQELPDLDILAQREADDSKRMPGLPSWVPDYTISQSKQPFDQTIYNISGKPSKVPTVRRHGTRIIIQGVAWQQIASVHPINEGSAIASGTPAKMKFMAASMNAVGHLFGENNPYQHDALGVLWRTMIAGHLKVYLQPEIEPLHWNCFISQTIAEAVELLGDGHPFTGTLFDPAKPGFKMLIDARARIKTSLYPSAEDLGVVDMIEKASSVFVTVAARIMENRQLFVTGAGFVGLGPKAMQPGDFLAYLDGARFYYILRPKGEEFQLIGEAYLHEAMNGELAEVGFVDEMVDIVLC